MNMYHLGVLQCFDENMNGVIYSQEILRGALDQSVRSMEMELEELDIIENLDPKHSLRCDFSLETVEQTDYKIVQNWSACSADLNPIEQIWSLLKASVSKRRNLA